MSASFPAGCPRSALPLTRRSMIAALVDTDSTILATDSKTEGGQANYESVTLEVTPVQAQMLVFALERGTVYLALRNKFDTAPARLAPEYIEKIVDPRKIGGPRSTSSSSASGPPPRPWSCPPRSFFLATQPTASAAPLRES